MAKNDDSTKFIHPEKLSGILLIAAALLALAIDNSPIAYLYETFLNTPVVVQFGALLLDKPLILWINDGLMAVFFFLIGLEIKREILSGELSSIKKSTLPIVAAIGGIVVPALIYVMINKGNDLALQGWAVPVATDIAFALGILALIGRSLPKEIKILLLSIAIIDDVAAIVIIALFYTDNLSVTALSLGSLGLISAIGLNVMGVKRIAPYIMIGIFMWVCVLKSGVHATLAGVVLAMCIPMTGEKNDCPVEELEHALHPWVFFGIMPLFAFANAGVNLSGFSMDMVTASIPLGIILGLFVGKQLGVFAFIWAGVKSGLCQRPASLSWAHIYGMSILTGIGFTMSLFIGTLAYDNSETLSQVRLGVLVASFLSALVGFVVLKLTSKIK
jgi:NhaA family Na+:H+ antiporter